MPPYVNSHVTRIEVDDKDGGNTQTVITVELVGYEKGESVQLIGYATQDNGAVAPINGVYDIGDVDPTSKAAYLKVPVNPSQEFVKQGKVTVILSAAQVWLTVLEEDDDVTPPVSRAWKPDYTGPAYPHSN